MKTLMPGALLFCGLLIAVESGFAQTWTQTGAPNVFWASVASSADGSKLIAADSSPSGGIYTSTNSGETWMTNDVPMFGWNSVSLSANGSILAAFSKYNSVYASTNGGTTWAKTTSGLSLILSSVATSADGHIMFVAALGGTNFFFSSTNAGASWISNNCPSLQQIAPSADATKLVAAGTGIAGPIYTSTDSGITWMSNSVPPQRSGVVASSVDGKTLAAASHDTSGVVFTSTNFGSTWTPANVPNKIFWESIAISADGTQLVAAGYSRGSSGYPNLICVSTNSGVSWVSNAPLPGVFFVYGVFVASSADGNKLATALGQGKIYTSFTVPVPQLDIAPKNNSLLLSWLVPSTNFVLQQKSDLTTADWLTLSNTPTLNLSNLNDEVVLPLSNSSGFFRLMAE